MVGDRLGFSPADRAEYARLVGAVKKHNQRHPGQRLAVLYTIDGPIVWRIR